MDWTQTLTILGVFIAGFVYMMSRMDSHKKDTDQKFEHLGERVGKVENRLTGLEAEIKTVNQRIDGTNQRLTDFRTDINQRLSTIEGYLVPKKIYRFSQEPEDYSKEQ